MITDGALVAELADAYGVSTADERRLHGRLVSAASHAGLLDVAYRVVDSPVGSLLLAATDQGLVRVGFANEGHDAVLQSLADRISPRVLAAPSRLEDAARQLEEYFTGRRRSFELAIDWQLSSGFRHTVLTRLPGIGYGAWVTYKDLAEQAGNPKAVRAVGSACATNPLPVVIPCHRVLRSDGSLGGYLGGLEAKRALLDLEAAA